MSDLIVLAVTMAFRLAAAFVGFICLLSAIRIIDAWRAKRGYKREKFFGGDPLAQGVFTGLMYLACAVLVGLAIG